MGLEEIRSSIIFSDEKLSIKKAAKKYQNSLAKQKDVLYIDDVLWEYQVDRYGQRAGFLKSVNFL